MHVKTKEPVGGMRTTWWNPCPDQWLIIIPFLSDNQPAPEQAVLLEPMGVAHNAMERLEVENEGYS